MTYASEVLSDAPFVYWRLGEASGNPQDSSGGGRHGVWFSPGGLGYQPVRGEPSLIAGNPDAAVRIDPAASVNAYVGPFTAQTFTAITLEAWVKPEAHALTNDPHAVLFGNVTSGAARIYIQRADNIPRMLARTGAGTVQTGTTGVAPLAVGTTYHVVGTYDGTTVRLYVNGALVASNSGATGPLAGTQTYFSVSGQAAGPYYWAGTLDEAAVYPTALSATRIAAHYATGTTAPAASVALGRAARMSIARPVSTGLAVAVGRAARGAVARTVAPAPGAVSHGVARAVRAATARPVALAISTSAALGRAGSSHAAAPITFTQTDPIAPTSTGNRVGGRVRVGAAVATWEPPVAPPPPNAPTVLAYDVAHAFGAITQRHGTQPTYEVSSASVERQRDRVLVGGVDVTFFRGVPTPLPSYQLVMPLLYGPATLVFPQIAGTYEQLGAGDLRWLRKGAPVVVQRVNPTTGAVERTDYRGFVIAFNVDGPALSVEVGGQASGRAALTNKQTPMWHRVFDAGRMAWGAVRRTGCRFEPRLGPDTGIRLANWGGLSWLDYINELCAKAQDRDGAQWTILPDEDGVYRMARKDLTATAATVYLDDARAVGSLRRDIAEEPNRVYMTGVNPHGRRVRGAVYPGLTQGDRPPYPFTDHRSFGEGITNAETDTGDGIAVMVARLWTMKYLDLEDTPGGYDRDARRAIRQLQEDASLPVTGVMTYATWRALFDLSATGYSLRGSRIEPMAQRSAVKPWALTSSGAKMARNPGYDPAVVPVDINIDAGVGFTAHQLREWARAELSHEDNWVGTIKLATGAVLAGTHTPGDPVTAADVLRARDLRPGDNVWCPLFMGGTRLHVSAVAVDSAGTVTLTVDTRARDTMKVWQIIQRNRETRANPARAWVAQHRSSTVTKDSATEWDAAGGVIERTRCPGAQWTVFPVAAGQEGTVRSLRIRTEDDRAEYVVAVFGRSVSPRFLHRHVPNPLTAPSTFTTMEDGSEVTHERHDNAARWESEAVRRKLDARLLLYAAGTDEQPCGYFPGKKTGENGKRTRDHLTGRHEDDAGISYHTFAEPVLYVAIYPDRNTVIQPGRIMWNQLEAGA